MATWHGTIAGAMAIMASDLALLAARSKTGDLTPAETRSELAVIQTILADCNESLRRLAEQEEDGKRTA